MELRDDPLLLRSWCEDDALAVYAACQDPELHHWLSTLPRPYKHEDARAFVTDALGLGPYQLAICEAGNVVGSIGLRVGKGGTGRIGYWCAAEARGRGITTRALRRLCGYAFDELGLERLDLIADVENRASQRVAEKVGFRREGVLRSHMPCADGRRRDSVLLSLLPAELPALAAGSQHHVTNRSHWDALAAVHGQDDYYDSRGLVAGQSSLVEEEECALAEAVGDVADLNVLHVQCHIGFDTVTIARRGARVTGVDFSEASLAKARALAERCGVDIEWVAAEITELPEALHERFDLAWATIGVLCWIADLGAWMRSVAGTLVPGGHLVLIDGHPLSKMVASTDPLVLSLPYAGAAPLRFEDSTSYTNAPAPTGPSVEFAHSLGEIVTAAADAGLMLTGLTEHLDVSFDHRSGYVKREPDGRYRLRLGGGILPTLFTLRAVRPAEYSPRAKRGPRQ